MPADMKEQIAKAAQTLIMERNVKRLTVKDIVEECHITRQTFYYHFEDIPHLLQWVLVKGLDEMHRTTQEYDSLEDCLRYLFRISAQSKPYVEKALASNYGTEFDRILKQEIMRLAEEIAESNHQLQNLSREEMRIVMQYHTQALLGLIHEWCDLPQDQTDRIIHTVCRILKGEIALTDNPY